MTYFVIRNYGGDTYVQQMNEDELLKALNPDGHGDVEFNAFRALTNKALTSLIEADTSKWGDSFLVIEGEVVVPRAKLVVTRIVV